jgi:hypothetical protein
MGNKTANFEVVFTLYSYHTPGTIKLCNSETSLSIEKHLLHQQLVSGAL